MGIVFRMPLQAKENGFFLGITDAVVLSPIGRKTSHPIRTKIPDPNLSAGFF